MRLPSDATLLVVDADAAVAEAPRAPSDPAACIRILVDVWRSVGLATICTRRAADALAVSSQEGSDTRVARPGASAFAGTDLDERLTARGCTTLVVCGFDCDYGVEATVRHAADLGFRLFVVADACTAVSGTDAAGRAWVADDIQALALARMARAGATIVDWRTAWIAANSAGWGQR